jgi:hypothetical protein
VKSINGALPENTCMRCGLSRINTVHINRDQYNYHPAVMREDISTAPAQPKEDKS